MIDRQEKTAYLQIRCRKMRIMQKMREDIVNNPQINSASNGNNPLIVSFPPLAFIVAQATENAYICSQ